MTGRLPPTSLTIFPPLNLNLSPYRLQPPTSNISQHASTFFLCLQPQTSTPPPSNALPPQPFPKPPPTSNLNPPTSPRSSTARIERYNCPFQACSLSLEGWVLNDLPLRASNEGSLRPRVARAQKIIRPQPLTCSASKRTIRLPFPSFHDRALREHRRSLGPLPFPPTSHGTCLTLRLTIM